MKKLNRGEKKRHKKRKLDNSLILPFWNSIFGILEYISVFALINLVKEKLNGSRVTYRFVEIWVLSNLIAAIVSSVAVYRGVGTIFLLIIIAYGMLRVFEIIIYQINVLLFHPYRSQLKNRAYKIKSPTRIVVLLFHNYAEIIFWYTAIYMALMRLNGQMIIEPWFYYVKLSILCFATFDATLIYEGRYLNILSNFAFTQLIAGVIMTLVSLARFIGLLPDVESIDKL